MTPKEVARIVVDGVELPEVSELKGSYNDLDVDSGRTVNDGKMVRSRLRSEVNKIGLSYDLLSMEQAKIVLDAIQPVYINVEYYSVADGGRVTKTMYAGDKSYEWVVAIPHGSEELEMCVKSFTVDLIEI